jgi:hypothetical protein
MLPLAEVVPFLVDADMDAGLVPSTDETDRKCMSCLLHRVSDSKQGVCPDNGDEGDDVDISNKDECPNHCSF